MDMQAFPMETITAIVNSTDTNESRRNILTALVDGFGVKAVLSGRCVDLYRSNTVEDHENFNTSVLMPMRQLLSGEPIVNINPRVWTPYFNNLTQTCKWEVISKGLERCTNCGAKLQTREKRMHEQVCLYSSVTPLKSLLNSGWKQGSQYIKLQQNRF